MPESKAPSGRKTSPLRISSHLQEFKPPALSPSLFQTLEIGEPRVDVIPEAEERDLLDFQISDPSKMFSKPSE